MGRRLRSSAGAGLGVLFFSVAVFLCLLLVFVNMADYGLYSAKCGLMRKGLDYAVCAAVQEVDEAQSGNGLAMEFHEDSGLPSTDGIYLDEAAADEAFFETLRANTGFDRSRMEAYALLMQVNPESTSIRYVVKAGNDRWEGAVARPEDLEAVINGFLEAGENTGSGSTDRSRVFVNGNPETNEFKKRPYYIAVIENFEVDGIFRKRTATFVGFAGAKIERGM